MPLSTSISLSFVYRYRYVFISLQILKNIKIPQKVLLNRLLWMRTNAFPYFIAKPVMALLKFGTQNMLRFWILHCKGLFKFPECFPMLKTYALKVQNCCGSEECRKGGSVCQDIKKLNAVDLSLSLKLF